MTLGARWGCSSGPACSPSLRSWTTSVRWAQGPSRGKGKEASHRPLGEVCAGHFPHCLPPGFPREGPGILLEPKAPLTKALRHQSGNSPLFLPCHLHLGAPPHPMKPRTPPRPGWEKSGREGYAATSAGVQEGDPSRPLTLFLLPQFQEGLGGHRNQMPHLSLGPR